MKQAKYAEAHVCPVLLGRGGADSAAFAELLCVGEVSGQRKPPLGARRGDTVLVGCRDCAFPTARDDDCGAKRAASARPACFGRRGRHRGQQAAGVRFGGGHARKDIRGHGALEACPHHNPLHLLRGARGWGGHRRRRPARADVRFRARGRPEERGAPEQVDHLRRRPGELPAHWAGAAPGLARDAPAHRLRPRDVHERIAPAGDGLRRPPELSATGHRDHRAVHEPLVLQLLPHDSERAQAP